MIESKGEIYLVVEIQGQDEKIHDGEDRSSILESF